MTGELTNLFISENLELRQQKSEDTTKFLEQQLETARQNLAEQEEKVRIYKDQHLGELPSQLTSNVQILSGLQSQLQSEEDGLNADRQQNAYLQSMLEQSRALQRTTKSGDGTPVGIPALDQELDKLRAQLADLSSHYTDRHPDVRKLKDQIAKTEKMREQALADLKAGATTASGSGNPPASTTDDVDSGSPATIQLQGQLKANQIDMANKEHEIAALKAKIDDYQRRLNEEPAREQQFADLTRGYEQSKANYDELLKKKNSSQMATSMELLQQGEHFQMIDPPSLPLKPDFPNRLKFCGIGLGHRNRVRWCPRRWNRVPGRPPLQRESTQGTPAGERDLRDPGDHQSGRGKKAREEALGRLGSGRACFCDCSGRIGDKLLPRVMLVVNVQSFLQSEA